MLNAMREMSLDGGASADETGVLRGRCTGCSGRPCAVYPLVVNKHRGLQVDRDFSVTKSVQPACSPCSHFTIDARFVSR